MIITVEKGTMEARIPQAEWQAKKDEGKNNPDWLKQMLENNGFDGSAGWGHMIDRETGDHLYFQKIGKPEPKSKKKPVKRSKKKTS